MATTLVLGALWVLSYRYSGWFVHTSGLCLQAKPGSLDVGRGYEFFMPMRTAWYVYDRYGGPVGAAYDYFGPYWESKVQMPLIVPPVLTGALSAWLLWPFLFRRTPGLCSACCYDLTGNTTGVCPECGTPPSPDPRTSSVSDSASEGSRATTLGPESRGSRDP